MVTIATETKIVPTFYLFEELPIFIPGISSEDWKTKVLSCYAFITYGMSNLYTTPIALEFVVTPKFQDIPLVRHKIFLLDNLENKFHVTYNYRYDHKNNRWCWLGTDFKDICQSICDCKAYHDSSLQCTCHADFRHILGPYILPQFISEMNNMCKNLRYFHIENQAILIGYISINNTRSFVKIDHLTGISNPTVSEIFAVQCI
jgi:hypothetical protein